MRTKIIAKQRPSIIHHHVCGLFESDGFCVGGVGGFMPHSGVLMPEFNMCIYSIEIKLFGSIYAIISICKLKVLPWY